MDAIPMPDAARPIEADPSSRLGRLFDSHHARLYRLARRLSASRDDALDLVQETFTRAAARLATVPDDADREEAWLVRVLVNVQRDEWRKRKVRAEHRVRSRVDEAGPDVEAARIASATVWRAVTALPPRRRAVVVLHELDGLSVADVAGVLGMARATVRWHLFRARAELATALQAPGRTR